MIAISSVLRSESTLKFLDEGAELVLKRGGPLIASPIEMRGGGMRISSEDIARVIKSMMPKTREELSQLSWVIHFARRVQKGVWRDPRLEPLVAFEFAGGRPPSDVGSFIETLPSDCQVYFHGLVEALDVYHSIHGREVPLEEGSLKENIIHELRQIRDMCLDTNLRVPY